VVVWAKIDDSEVDLTALTWSRVVAALGGGADHEVLAVGIDEGEQGAANSGGSPGLFCQLQCQRVGGMWGWK